MGKRDSYVDLVRHVPTSLQPRVLQLLWDISFVDDKPKTTTSVITQGDGNMAVRAVSSDYAINPSDHVVKVTAAATLCLPTAVGRTGKEYRIDNAHTGNTTIVTNGVETIEGETMQTLSGECCMVVYSDGINWRIS